MPSSQLSQLSLPDDRFRAPRAIFWSGLIVRVLYMTLAHTYRLRLFQDHFQFGWEMGRIARALVTGYGYADPFAGHSGPTAWNPPLYPFLIAVVFKLFGIFTPLSAWVLLTINSVFSAAIAPAIYELAARCYGGVTPDKGRRIALWSAWLWALYPAAMQYAVRWVWEMSISCFLFTWVLVLALRVRSIGESPREDRQYSIRLWCAFGLLWGMIALTNSTLLLFLPFCGVWMMWHNQRRFRWKHMLAAVGTAALLFLACIAPWMWRNWTVFHVVIPIRGNFGAELYSSLLEGNNGFVWGPTVPLVEQDPEYQLYRRMGEHAYVQYKGELAHAYIRTHKKVFLQLAIKRLYFFWVSVPHPMDNWPSREAARVFLYFFGSMAGLMGLALSLKRRIPGAWLFAWAFLTVPLTYYFVVAGARFRHPLEPLLTIFAVFLFQSARPRRQGDKAALG